MSSTGQPVLHRIGAAASTFGREPPSRWWLRVLLQGGLTALVLGFLVFTVIHNWQELQEAEIGLAVDWLALGLAALVAFQVAVGLAWLLQLRMLGQSPNRVGAEMAWGKSLLARYVPGGVVFVMSRVVLSERERVPRRVTLTAMTYETALQFASAAAFAAWFLFAHPDHTAGWLRWAVLAAVPLALGCLHPRLFAPIVNRIFRAFGRRDGPALLDFNRVLMLFAYYSATWGVMGVGVFCVARAIYPVSTADWGVVAAAQAVAFCAAVLSLVFPGGLGIRDGAFAWAMKAAVPGQSFAVAAAIALTTRLALTASEVIYAGAATALARRRSPRPLDSEGHLTTSGDLESRHPGRRPEVLDHR